MSVDAQVSDEGPIIDDELGLEPSTPEEIAADYEAFLRQSVYLSIDEIVPAGKNPKRHAIEDLILAFTRFGYTQPLLRCNRVGKLAAGHGRLEALKQMRSRDMSPPKGITSDWRVPVIVDWASENDAEFNAYLAADNHLTEKGGWDNHELFELLDSLDDLDGTGYSLEDIRALEQEVLQLPKTPLTDPDHVPEPPKKAVSKRGDVWICGQHRVMCGDSTDPDNVLTLMGEYQGVSLLHADPPYGMGKEKDGVENDNLYRDKLDAFQMEWWKVWRQYLAENASAYIWGNAEDLWRLWYRGGLADSERLTLRNEIVWAKDDGGFGITSGEMRSFPPVTERLLFFMVGEQGFNNNADNYWEGWEPVRKWLSAERERSGLTTDDCNRICGKQNMTQSAFTKGGFRLILKEDYEKLKEACAGKAFTRPYEELKAEYEELKAEFYDSRAFFDNTHDNMTDVWQFARVKGDDRHGHATPKPVAMIERAIKSSCPVGEMVVEPFGGSGSTLIAAESVDRICYTMEITPIWVDVICKRFQEATGTLPVLESTGEAHDFTVD